MKDDCKHKLEFVTYCDTRGCDVINIECSICGDTQYNMDDYAIISKEELSELIHAIAGLEFIIGRLEDKLKIRG